MKVKSSKYTNALATDFVFDIVLPALRINAFINANLPDACSFHFHKMAMIRHKATYLIFCCSFHVLLYPSIIIHNKYGVRFLSLYLVWMGIFNRTLCSFVCVCVIFLCCEIVLEYIEVVMLVFVIWRT